MGGIMENFPLREFEKTNLIFIEGAPGDTAYILKEGQVRIFTKIKGERITLAELNPVTVFGEMALLSNEQKRTASAEAMSHVEVIEVDKIKLDHLMSQSPNIIINLVHALTQRLVDTTSRIYNEPH